MLPLCKSRANAHSRSELWAEATCRRGAKANDRSVEPSVEKLSKEPMPPAHCTILFLLVFLSLSYFIWLWNTNNFLHSFLLFCITHTHTHVLSSLLIYINNCARIKLHAMRRIFEFLSMCMCVWVVFIALSLGFTVLQCPIRQQKLQIGPKTATKWKQINLVYAYLCLYDYICICICI